MKPPDFSEAKGAKNKTAINIIFYSLFFCLLIGLLVYTFYQADTKATPVQVSAELVQNDILFEKIKADLQSEAEKKESQKAESEQTALESRIASENSNFNINTATFDELVALKTVGEVTAQKIIDYIKNNGNLGSIDELLTQKLVTKRQFEAIKSRIYV